MNVDRKQNLSALPIISYEVHDKTGADPEPFSAAEKAMEAAAGQLAREKGSDQDREGDELPAQSGEYPNSDDEGHRRVDREKPGARELLHAGPPVTEGEIKDKNNGCCR